MHTQRKDPKMAMLRRLPSLAGYATKDLETFAKLGDEIMLPAGERILREGVVGRQAFFVLEGRAVVTSAGRAVGAVGPGEFVGEWSLVRGEPRAATVTTETRMTVLAFDPRAFRTLEHHPALQRLVEFALDRNQRGERAGEKVAAGGSA